MRTGRVQKDFLEKRSCHLAVEQGHVVGDRRGGEQEQARSPLLRSGSLRRLVSMSRVVVSYHMWSKL